jgi:serine protease AprX
LFQRVRAKTHAVSILVTLITGAALFTTPAADAAGIRAFIDPPVLRAEGRTAALVHIRNHSRLASGIEAARLAGLDVGTRYEAIDVFVAYGTAAGFKGLASDPAVEAIEANRHLRYFTDTSHTATRGNEVLQGAVTLPDGTPIDGAGVGVAVVDSGIEGTHPDFQGRMGNNVKIICTTPQFAAIGNGILPFEECRGPKQAVPLDDTDTPSAGGHGTHVAGIVGGDGAASEGTFHGAAPGATLYGVSVGTVITVENALDGLAWVLENHDQVMPAIKVVNNSWGSGHSRYDPENAPFHKATWKLQEALVEAGVSVVFAAGNSGGNGSSATTGGECVNPTPGIVCVANYSDSNLGTRDGSLASTSSRGNQNQPDTWPDISAPGSSIVSTCRATLPVCATGLRGDTPNTYSTLSGTSMAAPHISGIVAQLYQADPALTPGQVEDVLKTTAHKFVFGAPYQASDPAHPGTTSFDKGHGLVDVTAAVAAVLGISDPGPGPGPDPDPDPEPGGPTRFYFHSATGQWQADVLGGLALTDQPNFDTEEPDLDSPALSTDIPLLGAGGPRAIYDPWWTGRIDDRISRFEVDFWQKAQGEALGFASWDVSIWVGDTQHLLPPLDVEFDPVTSDEPFRITHEFTTMLVDGNEVPLDINPAGQEVTVMFQGNFVDGSDGGAIVYDAVDYPSGFEIGVESESSKATLLSLAVDGHGSNSALIATLTEADEAGAAIQGRAIVFFADGDEIGTAVTDADGRALLSLPPRYRSGRSAFEAVFAGDDIYGPSSGST